MQSFHSKGIPPTLQFKIQQSNIKEFWARQSGVDQEGWEAKPMDTERQRAKSS
jgi:hypothetical protein